MAVTEQDYEQVRSRQAEARKLAETANLLGGRATSFGANVMDRVREARASRGISQLSTDIGAATGRLASEGPAIRERMATVNPLQVDVATSQARAAELANLASMADWQTATQGTLTDVIGAGTDRLKAMAAAKQAEAQTAAQEASDLIEMIQLKEAQEARAFQELMAEKEMKLAEEKFAWEKTKPTGGAGGLTAGQTSDLRREMVEDAVLDLENGIDRETSRKRLTVAYPELVDEVEGVLNSVYPPEPASTPATTGTWGLSDIASGAKSIVPKASSFFENVYQKYIKPYDPLSQLILGRK